MHAAGAISHLLRCATNDFVDQNELAVGIERFRIVPAGAARHTHGARNATALCIQRLASHAATAAVLRAVALPSLRLAATSPRLHHDARASCRSALQLLEGGAAASSAPAASETDAMLYDL